ncbi:hypothetical protein VTN77DRAFT_946 [Rasamsonia byssochlamydoides]|uniref:uncharacterized protein n=1 Tax=Rasamsonia byssochlamydoides TaxID=89139 RepID=UPI003744AD2B
MAKEPVAFATSDDSSPAESIISDGSLKFVYEQGGNNALPSYQEASGAPVEAKSPLGYKVRWVSAAMLNIGQMVGTGVFSTPSTILTDTGSVGLALIYWALGFVVAAANLAVYLEFTSYFPSRSGSEVVYLEQAYPRPKYLLPTTFAVQSVILSFSSGNAIVLAEYLFQVADYTPTNWQLKGVAIAGYTVAVLLLAFHTRFSLYLVNVVTIVKIITLTFISILGLVVLGGHTKVPDPTANFRNAFEGTTNSGYGITNALVKVIFAYAGYTNAMNVVNEVKTLKKSASLSLIIVAVLYVLCNIAYFAAVPKAELAKSEQIAASLLFTAVFGSKGATRGLSFLIALSAFGNLIAVLVGQSRMIRECARQGVIPFPKFWVNTRPFGTPLGPYFLKWFVTIIMIIAPPAGDAFNFIVDLQTYTTAVFSALLALGIFLIRRQRKHIGKTETDFRAWNIAAIFTVLVNIYLLAMPWYPPLGGADGGDVSFWYGTYCAVGLGILAVCVIYYIIWIYLLPKVYRYQIRQEVVVLEDGSTTHRLVKVPNEEVAAWDEQHDVEGNVRHRMNTGVDNKEEA